MIPEPTSTHTVTFYHSLLPSQASAQIHTFACNWKQHQWGHLQKEINSLVLMSHVDLTHHYILYISTTSKAVFYFSSFLCSYDNFSYLLICSTHFPLLYDLMILNASSLSFFPTCCLRLAAFRTSQVTHPYHRANMPCSKPFQCNSPITQVIDLTKHWSSISACWHKAHRVTLCPDLAWHGI